MENPIFLALMSGLIASLIAVAYQIWRDRAERRRAQIERRKDERLRVIGDLVAYRYVLTGRANPRGVAAFNSALNRIPIDFIDDRSVLDKYRAIGHNFNAEKFHSMILSMIDATVGQPHHIDLHLLENTPSATQNPPELNVVFSGEPISATEAQAEINTTPS